MLQRPRSARDGCRFSLLRRSVVQLAAWATLLAIVISRSSATEPERTPSWRAAAAMARARSGKATYPGVSTLSMEHSLQRMVTSSADATGPAASAWDASPLLKRHKTAVLPDFAPPAVSEPRVWRCVRFSVPETDEDGTNHDNRAAGEAGLLQEQEGEELHGELSRRRRLRSTQGRMGERQARLGPDSAVSGAREAEEEEEGMRGTRGRGGRGGRREVSVPLRLTPLQEHTVSLLAVGERLGALARGEALHGTIYEVIIHPAMNAMAYITPRLVYFLAREILVILFQWIIKWMLLPAIVVPACSGMDASSVTTITRTSFMERSWSSINDLTQTGEGLVAAAQAANAETASAAKSSGLGDAISKQFRDGAGDVFDRLARAAASDGTGGGAGAGAGGGAGGGGGDGSGGKGGDGSGSGGSHAPFGFASEVVWPDPSVHWHKHTNVKGHMVGPHPGAASKRDVLEQALSSRLPQSKPDDGQAANTNTTSSTPALTSLLQASARGIPSSLLRGPLAMPGVAGKVAAASTSLVSSYLTPRLREKLRARLLPVVARTAAQRVVEVAVPRLTASVVPLLVREVTKQLLGNRRLRSRLLARLSARLLPRVAQGLTVTVAEAVKRDPRADMLCFLCHKQQLYCAPCLAARREEVGRQHASMYAAKYFAAYHMGVWAKAVGW